MTDPQPPHLTSAVERAYTPPAPSFATIPYGERKTAGSIMWVPTETTDPARPAVINNKDPSRAIERITTNKGIIIGFGVSGGVLGLFSLVVAVLYIKRRWKARKLKEMRAILESEAELKARERRERKIAAGEEIELEEVGGEFGVKDSGKKGGKYKKITSTKDLKQHYFV